MSAKYRKKPVVIDAAQWDGSPDTLHALMEATAERRPHDGKTTLTTLRNEDLTIRTLEGDMRCEIGDWLICGVQGEFYPCKPDIFAATYEPVEDGYMSPDDRLRDLGSL